ncbi:Lipid-A-disaccharide synthase [hydrothermal vent metagenome]|uniref:lipid-A-disaccharide synthase n=1 Tax=hydrothermal vent metagenome TaxID=652676 RepID=A0A3B0TJE5_9ZZZZ
MKYYLIAGEASGDLHGSNLMKELKKNDKEAHFRFFGGDLMQEVEDNLVRHYREMAFMGVIEVIFNIRAIKRNFRLCKSDLIRFNPDVVILIDYPGFNMKIAKFAKKAGLKVYYYISPKIWAWKEWRIKKIKAFVDEMFTILPFEAPFFEKYNYPVHYVGNPLVGFIEEYKMKSKPERGFRENNGLDGRPIVAMLPGSRTQEIKLILPVMAAMRQFYPGYQFVISGAPSIPGDLYRSVLEGVQIPVLFNQTYDLLIHSYAAIVTSGTATLETALFNVPQVVLYKMRGNKYLVKLLRAIFIKVDFFSLPNLVLNEEAVKELVMHEMTVENVKPELGRLLGDADYRKGIIEKYDRLREIMGPPGAAKRAAQKMIELIRVRPGV